MASDTSRQDWALFGGSRRAPRDDQRIQPCRPEGAIPAGRPTAGRARIPTMAGRQLSRPRERRRVGAGRGRARQGRAPTHSPRSDGGSQSRRRVRSALRSRSSSSVQTFALPRSLPTIADRRRASPWHPLAALYRRSITPTAEASRLRVGLAVAFALLLAVVGAEGGDDVGAEGADVLLDSGSERTPVLWYPAGLQTELSEGAAQGRGASTALEVHTLGVGEGEGPGVRGRRRHPPGEAAQLLDLRTQSRRCHYLCRDPRWKAKDGSFIEASRGTPLRLGSSWQRLVASGVAPKNASSALVVVGEVCRDSTRSRLSRRRCSVRAVVPSGDVRRDE